MTEHVRATTLVRAALQLRMRLLPYVDAAFARYAATGVPPCRALAMDYPDDPLCRTSDDQWLLGEDLLVAPVLPGRTTRAVVLPPGRWRALGGGEVLTGGCIHTIDAPLELLPVFVRDGAILPLAEPVARIAPDTVFQLTAEVYGDGARSCELIEDDGRSLAAPANRVNVTWDGSTAKLARSGSWDGRRFALVGWTHRP